MPPHLTIIKILGIVVIMIAIYLFLEEQMDASLSSKRPGSGGDKSSKPLFGQAFGAASFEDQLIEALLMISSSLKAGRNLDQAFELVAVSTPAPICNQFQTLVQERRLGVSMVEALGNLARRVKSADLRLAVNATIFQQETGGNLEDLYKQIVVTVTERKKIMGKVIAGTAHARLSGTLVGSIPVIIVLFISMLHPTYLVPMIENPVGLMLLALTILLAVVGIFVVRRMTSGILPECEESVAHINEARSKGDVRWGFIRPVLSMISAVVNGLFSGLLRKYKEGIKFSLEASGYAGDFSPDEFIALKFLSAFLFIAVLAFSLRLFITGMLGVLLLVLILPIGFHLPQIFLVHRIRQRQQNIEYELPYTIDLLSLAIESGLDLVGGIQKIVEKSRPTDIIVEFKMFLADIKVGKSLEEALSEMADRVQVLSFFSFVSSLIQAQRLGAEIGPTLRSQAEMMRYQRMILAEERVNKLPVKLLIPLVFFIFPSITVLLIGPSLIQLNEKMSQGSHLMGETEIQRRPFKRPIDVLRDKPQTFKEDVRETLPEN